MNSLEKLTRTTEWGVITQRKFVENAAAQGWTVEVKELNGYQDGAYNRRKFNRMDGEEQKKYEAQLNKVRTVYEIHPPGANYFYDITATQYKYFQTITTQGQR